MIHQFLIPQFQRYCKLNGIQGTKTRVEGMTLDQRLGARSFPFADGENLKFSGGDVLLKLAQEYVRVLTIDGLGSHIDRERRCQFSNGQPGDSDQVACSINDLLDNWCASLLVVELHQSVGIEEIAGQGSTVPSLSNNLCRHRSRNLGKPPGGLRRYPEQVPRPAVAS